MLTAGALRSLLDGALPQSAPLIDANIKALGFTTTDVKYILTSHAHFDHVGGMRSMQRYTRATVLASRDTARALALGHPVPEDPQFEAASKSQDFPALLSLAKTPLVPLCSSPFTISGGNTIVWSPSSVSASSMAGRLSSSSSS